MEGDAVGGADDKSALRARLIAARRGRSAAEIEAARTAVVDVVLARCAAARWRCVAAYEPLRTEPGSRQLLAGLHGLGVSVVVPALLPDNDLDWMHWHPDPEWPRVALGVDAIALADAVLVPALAVGADGMRLGRGGGSYDRALERVGDVPVVALLFDDEVLAAVPAEPHDRPVTAVVSPGGWRELG